MALGFITLENGKNFSVRWTGYDEVIRIAIKELDCLDGGTALQAWLKTRVPNEGDHEGGALFYNESGEMILRSIDLRGLTQLNRQLFWAALEMGAIALLKLGREYNVLNPIVLTDLLEMHRNITDTIQIVEQDEHYIVTNDDVIEKTGPGWAT